tara:strand:- start:12339 stop:12722 length:384 start_codon:yes stop_codon:yes gene_type:complete
MINKVAVYGSLREGFGNHRILEGSDKLGTHWVPGYEMFSLGAFPGVRKGNTHVFTEVYEVDADTMRRLDILEGYGGESEANFYDRTEVNTPYGDAFMYTLEGHRYKQSELVDSGNWAHFKTKLKDLI